MNPRLVLGSASPRRRDLLAQLGLPFEQVVSPESEPDPQGQTAVVHVSNSAWAKAQAVHRFLDQSGELKQPTLVIGADTVVCVDGRILGKPADEQEAAVMLGLLSGRVHQVYSGVAVFAGYNCSATETSTTIVRMRPLSAADIDAYVISGEPMDKAGAYGIQGLGARFVEHIDGCFFNVVGLPLQVLSGMLEAVGYDFNSPGYELKS